MPELTLNDIDKIASDIRRQEINFSHLADELLDHICCQVEQEMNTGLSFNDAYRRVKKILGPRRLKEIQEETLYAVDTKYRRMKNLMKISGIAGTILFGFASLFKIQHWAGAGIMMTAGAFILAFLFMPSSLGVLWKETHNRNRIFLFVSSFLAATLFIIGTLFKIQHWPAAGWILLLAFLSGILLFLPAVMTHLMSDTERRNRRGPYITGAAGFVLYMAGLLFKIQHWPSATLLLIAGLILSGTIALPWYAYIKWKDEKNITSQFLYIIITSLLIVIPGMMINLNLQNTYESGYYPNLFRQQTMFKYLRNSNDKYLEIYSDSLNYSHMGEVRGGTDELLAVINNIESKMIQEAEGDPGMPAIITDQIRQGKEGPEIQFRMLKSPFHTGPFRDFLKPGTASRQELDQSLGKYLGTITLITNEPDAGKYSDLLDASIYLPSENRTGMDISLLSALHSLELLKNSVLTVEQQALLHLASVR